MRQMRHSVSLMENIQKGLASIYFVSGCMKNYNSEERI